MTPVLLDMLAGVEAAMAEAERTFAAMAERSTPKTRDDHETSLEQLRLAVEVLAGEMRARGGK